MQALRQFRGTLAEDPHRDRLELLVSGDQVTGLQGLLTSPTGREQKTQAFVHQHALIPGTEFFQHLLRLAQPVAGQISSMRKIPFGSE